MSLATAGAGGAGLGGAGLSMSAMAHNTGPNALAQQQAHQGNNAHGSIPSGSGYTAAPGTSYAALGADLLDKNQSFLNGKNVRNVARLPIVAVDLYGDECGVAYFPPMENNKDDKKKKDGGGSNGFSVEGMGNEEMMEMMKAMARLKKGVQARSIGGLNGRVGANVILKREDDASYKAVRRHLSKGMGHGVVLEDALVLDGKMHNDNDDDGDGEDVIVLPRPHLLMGARSTNDLSPAARAAFESLLPKGSGKGGKKSSKKSAPTSSIIDQEQSTAPLSLTTIAMDGNTSPKGDDYDRVAFQMRLNSKKKLMTILPDEAVGIVIAQARKSVRDGYLKEHPESELNTAESGGGDNGGEDDDTFMDYPPAFAIPGWATMDTTLEALIDAAGGSSSACGPSLHQRSIAACVGALLPPPASAANATQQQPQAATKLVKLCMEAMQTKDAEAAKEAGVQAALNKTEPVEPEPYIPLVILVGATIEGIEITAVQLSKPQTPDKELHCPFGNISVISSVCCSHKDPLSMLESTLDQLRSQVGLIVPESEEPTAIVTYGTIGMQLKLSTKLKSALTKYGKDGKNNDDWDGWDQDIPLVSTKEECVSMGLAVLAASVHGRVRLIVQVKGTDGKMRPKARLGVSVQDVATSAVAISFNYFGGKEEKWTDPKVIFDFDRRVPAGPYRIDFTAAECAAHVRHCKKDDKNSPCCIEDESVLIEQAKSLEGSRGIPDREAAALQLRFRIFQKATRGGDDWIQVGDTMRPLSMKHSQKDEGESGTDDLVACESAVLEVSLNTVGLITTGFGSNGETIVQATKSARNSKLLKWAGIIGSITFIGGFLIKSYVEEKVFDRDTQRVIAYYKHAAPNSFHDGDERHARYMVWKYKGKKDALWRRLEAKYDVPVLHEWEWETWEEEKAKKEEEEAEDLDGNDGAGESEEL